MSRRAWPRELPDKRFRYDANEGWDRSRRLEPSRCSPASARSSSSSRCRPPTAKARPGCSTARRSSSSATRRLLDLEHLDEVVDLYDGFVVKLAKAGGIAAAAALMTACKERAGRVLLGCMVESSLGIAAGLHVAGLADYVDLDGFLLIAADPFSGLAQDGDLLMAPNAPGLGVEPSPVAWAVAHAPAEPLPAPLPGQLVVEPAPRGGHGVVAVFAVGDARPAPASRPSGVRTTPQS